MKRILWIAGRLPTPLFSGDALYSAGLIKSLALTNEAEVTVVGSRRSEHAVEKPFLGLPQITCVDARPSQVSAAFSLASSLPKDAYFLATPDLRARLLELLDQSWDWIVIDHAYSSGFLDIILSRRQAASICYVAHNAEGLIRREIARNFDNPARRLLMGYDARKYRNQEDKILQFADAVICITDEDASYFGRSVKRTYVLPPVFLGKATPARAMTSDTPRALLLLGSFEWVAKQRNLDILIDSLLSQFKLNGISLNVVGGVPKPLRDRYESLKSHLVFHGRLPDISEIACRCRAGLVPELFGGGFKLKMLDYAFARLPIFGLKNAIAGTTEEEQSAMFLAESVTGLGAKIVENIDNLDMLNQSQARLFTMFSDRFGLESSAARMHRALL
ncbi:glycosyltransferase [Bradyrhizobium sp. CCGUVB23]|uniref:glycosyltransferase n=1 Tax=Bradyrhizobium sp. CCGUVB23 TaxID=2949630 RepID=UPI0020B3EA73|nr:glycosyltransferase [Bradyrhizobium sp. CCGUVB23]MCP3460067.1 glycosyltransferase [Bradyrhizobium sp. CCGUVB23]